MGIAIGLAFMPSKLPPLTNRLRIMRNRAKLSQRAVGEHMEVDHTTVGRWENDETPVTMEIIEKLAKLYGCHPAELIVDIERIASTQEELKLLSLFRSAPDDARESLLKTLLALAPVEK